MKRTGKLADKYSLTNRHIILIQTVSHTQLISVYLSACHSLLFTNNLYFNSKTYYSKLWTIFEKFFVPKIQGKPDVLRCFIKIIILLLYFFLLKRN